MTDLSERSTTAVGEPTATTFGVRALTLLLILLIGIPSTLIFSALGSAGTPALVLGLGLLVACIFLAAAGGQSGLLGPIPVALLVFTGCFAVSYIAAMTRAIPAIEVRAADRGMLTVLAWLGIALFVIMFLRSRVELDTVLRRLTIAGGLLGALGVVQFLTGLTITNLIIIPGLSENGEIAGLLGRNNLNRPAGTTIHPIEFGAVLTMILPFALHYALNDEHRTTLRRWWPVVAIAVAVPISISRSAIVSAVVVLLFMLPAWSATLRRRCYGAVAVLVVFMYLSVPGLIGTLTGLFTGISQDGSARSRTDSYALAAEFISRSPFFGRGFRTFLPAYRILDNQYLGLMIEVGFVGLAATLALQLMAIVSALRVRRASTDAATRHLAVAMAASVASNTFSLAFYDGLGFPMAAALFFFVIGCVGSLQRLSTNRSLPPVVTRRRLRRRKPASSFG